MTVSEYLLRIGYSYGAPLRIRTANHFVTALSDELALGEKVIERHLEAREGGWIGIVFNGKFVGAKRIVTIDAEEEDEARDKEGSDDSNNKNKEA